MRARALEISSFGLETSVEVCGSNERVAPMILQSLDISFEEFSLGPEMRYGPRLVDFVPADVAEKVSR